MNRPRVLLLNQFLPPDPAPTARLAADLMAGIPEVEWVPVGSGRDYRRGWRGGVVRRLGEEWGDLQRMRARAEREVGVSGMVVFSSPPMLLAEVAGVARRLGVPLHHWVLDLYPDVAVALGQVPALVGRWFAGRMRAGFQACATVTGVDEAMAERVEMVYGKACGVCRPWPERVEEEPFAGWEGVPEGAPVWLYSGNLGRAHVWSSLVLIQAELERRGAPWWLVVQGGGSGWEALRREVARRALKQVATVPYAAAGQVAGAIRRALVGVATQREALRGMLWPSKVGALAEEARAVLWLGPALEGGSNPLRFREGVGAFGSGEIEPVVSGLERIRAEPPPGQSGLANRIGLREAGLAYWRRILLR
ncbi:MAG: hypothetical protein SNJ84_08895 [Verrucomicrobiia bacterium]